jgi:beta-glucuronidase
MLRRLLLGFVCLFLACSGHAQQPAPLITNVANRKAISLNGDWHVIVDPYDSGANGYRGPANAKDTFFANAHPKNKHDLVEYNFAKSPALKVPGDWNSQSPQLFFYEGTVWYERSFSYHPNGARVFLYVGAANYASRVGVNGTMVCSHEGGFTPFNCEITPLLHEGGNFVVISVNDRRQRDAVPTVMTDWWNYGGLTREVELLEVPRSFVQDYSLQLERGTPQRITGWVNLSTKSADQITVRIPELSLHQSIDADASGLAAFSFHVANLQPWSPENPKLYDVEISTATDTVKDQIGFRTIEGHGKDILLNGKPIFLRGVSIHEEAPYRSGRAYSEEDARTLLGWAKELGANFVRLAHYPHNENMLRMADRMGLMVWSEVPVYWGIDWENPATLANAEAQLTDSITRDRNRASIIIWSVGNETPVTESRTRFMRQMVATARNLDSTRLVSAALQVQHNEGSTRVIDDPLGADLDVLGCNEYIGWYEGTADDADKASWKTPYDKPLIISEFGAGAKHGLHGDPDTRFTEEFQADVYEHQIQMLKRIDFLRGTTPWILMDFRSPRRLLPGIQDYYNRKGLLSDKGEKKKAFYVLQKWYREKAGSQLPAPNPR